MANAEHVALLRMGPEVWAEWRTRNPGVVPDLSRARLGAVDARGFDLAGANLAEADLAGANLVKAVLVRARLVRANLAGALLAAANLGAARLGWANLRRANLWMAHLAEANLVEADLTRAGLIKSNFSGTVLAGASLREARLGDTVFANVDLGRARHLVSCVHEGPSALDHRTLQRSGTLPLSFLRGCGLPDAMIERLPDILAEAEDSARCVILSCSEDRDLAERLHADLHHRGIRCWHSDAARSGEAARVVGRHRAKLLVVLSPASLASPWIQREVAAVLHEERRLGGSFLVGVRVEGTEPPRSWCLPGGSIHDGRRFASFEAWRDRDAYPAALERLLGILRTPSIPAWSMGARAAAKRLA